MEEKVDCPVCDRRNVVPPDFLARFGMCARCKHNRIKERMAELKRQKVNS